MQSARLTFYKLKAVELCRHRSNYFVLPRIKISSIIGDVTADKRVRAITLRYWTI